MTTVNINDKVVVRLNYVGIRQFRNYYLDLGLDPEVYVPYYKKTNKDWEFQIWELMHIFGPLCYNGGTPPFVNNRLTFRKEARWLIPSRKT